MVTEPAKASPAMKPTAAVESAASVEPATAMEAAATKSGATVETAIATITAARESTAAYEPTPASETAAIAIIPSIVPAPTIVTASPATPPISVPRTRADEDAVHEIIGSPITIGRTGIRRIIIISVVTNGRRSVRLIHRAEANTKSHHLCVRLSCREKQNPQ